MPPDARLAVINDALIFLGEAPLATLDNPASAKAVAASIIWPGAFDEVLRAHPWNFAVKRAILEPDLEAPPDGFSRQFSRPADWLRTLSITGVNDYRHEGTKILANVDLLRLRYIHRLGNVADMDALARAALARNLAHKLCYPITKSTTKEADQWDKYVQILSQAKGVDAQEDPNDQDEIGESSLLLSRRI